MYAIFTDPNGKRYKANAFWYQPFSRCNACPNDIILPNSCSWADAAERMPPDPMAYLTETGTPFPWRIRFTPQVAGFWTYRVYVRSKYGRDATVSKSFHVAPSDNKGFITTDTNHRYFRFSRNGDVFLPLGLNVIRVSALDTLYNRIPMVVTTSLIDQMAPHGGNLVRIMMGPENFGIEWNEGPPGNYDPRQNRAFDLDSVMSIAEEKGVYVQFMITTAGEMRMPWWLNNPYNASNGGPISETDSFFINQQSKELYQRKLRYIIARWGYSTQLFGYELVQEIELYTDYSLGGDYWANYDNVKNWYREMIRYCKTMDTNHIYGVSTANHGAAKTGSHAGLQNTIFGLPEIDFINEHHYSADYNVEFQRNYIARLDMGYYPDKPMMFGEMGIAWGGAWVGVNNYTNHPIYHNNDWHNSMWSTSFGGGAGPGLGWLNFSDLVHSPDLYPGCWGGQYKYFGPLGLFLEDDPIFLSKPLPIANVCAGRGPKDNIWHDTCRTCRYGYDSVTNRNSCFPRWNVWEDKVKPEYISRGVMTTNDSMIQVFGLKTTDRVIGWVHNKQNYWYKLPHKAGGNPQDAAFITDNVHLLPYEEHGPPTLDKDSMAVTGLSPGAYQLDWYSTYSEYDINPKAEGAENGGVIPGFGHILTVGDSGIAKFRIPSLRPIRAQTNAPFAPDYGFKITSIAQ
jgi:hypothetical protein